MDLLVHAYNLPRAIMMFTLFRHINPSGTYIADDITISTILHHQTMKKKVFRDINN